MKTFHWIVLFALAGNAGLLFGVKPAEKLNDKSMQTTATVQPLPRLHDGDLVLRNGRGIVSSWFRKMSKVEQRYTHAGLLHIHDGKAFVLHCYQDKVTPGLVEEPLEKFVNKHLCSDYAIYHYDLNEEQRSNLVASMEGDIRNGVRFDNNFELKHDNKQYCTEWVFNKINQASENTNYIPVSKVDGFAYVAPDNLYLNRHATCSWKQSY